MWLLTFKFVLVRRPPLHLYLSSIPSYYLYLVIFPSRKFSTLSSKFLYQILRLRQMRFRNAKSTQYLWTIMVIYICNNSTNNDTSQYGSTNNRIGIQYISEESEGSSLCVSLKVCKEKSTAWLTAGVLIHFWWVSEGSSPPLNQKHFVNQMVIY